MLSIALFTLPAHALEKADLVQVFKAKRVMVLSAKGQELARYDIALGFGPLGHKEQEGDGRTPEGRYRIDWKNPNSAFHLSLHISYPNEQDKARAKAAGVSPGGDIFIHGEPNGWRSWKRLFLSGDWTAGCIAVTNLEIEEIWQRVDSGTPIVIYP